jgi:hypothetical protein
MMKNRHSNSSTSNIGKFDYPTSSSSSDDITVSIRW